MNGLHGSIPYFSPKNDYYSSFSFSSKKFDVPLAHLGDAFNCKVRVYPDNTFSYVVSDSSIFGVSTSLCGRSSDNLYRSVFQRCEDAKKLHYQHLKVLDIISTSYSSVNAYLFSRRSDREQRNLNMVSLSDRERDFLRSLRKSLRTDNLKKTKENLYDYVACNVWDWFFTGTFDPDRYNVTNADDLKKVLQSWFKNMVFKYHISYIVIFEYHKKGGIHLHGLLKEDALYPLKLVLSGTKSYYGFKKPMLDSTAIKHGLSPDNGHDVYNLKTWRFGWSTAIKVYGNTQNIAKYVTKYITKSNQKIMGRYFWHSQDLDKPKTFYINTSYDDLNVPSYHGFKYYYLSGDSPEVQGAIEDMFKNSNPQDFISLSYQDSEDKTNYNTSDTDDFWSGWVDL